MRKMLGEKLIRVPQDLVDDIAEEFFPYFLSIFIRNLVGQKSMFDSPFSKDYQKLEHTMEEVLKYFRMSQDEINDLIIRLIQSGMYIKETVYDLTKYTFAYGNLPKYYSRMMVVLPKRQKKGKNLLGGFSKEGRTLYLFPEIVSHCINAVTDRSVEIMGIDLKGRDLYKIFLNEKKLIQLILKTKEFLQSVVEHELIHLVQHAFFSDYEDYETDRKQNYFQYIASAIERNPQLLSSLEDLKHDYPDYRKRGGITRSEFESFVSSDFLFSFEKDPTERKRLIRDFYQLVKDRIGIIN